MRVLAITHGPSVGPGVFADAVRAGGHELVEHQLPTAGALDNREADAIVVLGGAMHPDEEERHGWLRPELRYLEQPARARDADARRLPGLAADRASSRSARLPGGRARGRLAPGRGDGGGRRRIPSARRCRPRSTRSSGTTTRTTFRTAPSSSRAARSACRPTGSATHGASSSIRRCGPSRSSRGSPRTPTTSPTPRHCAPQTRERIADWNDLGRRLCTAFLHTI